jgi:ABC-type sulfate transport system permease subunit
MPRVVLTCLFVTVPEMHISTLLSQLLRDAGVASHEAVAAAGAAAGGALHGIPVQQKGCM